MSEGTATVPSAEQQCDDCAARLSEARAALDAARSANRRHAEFRDRVLSVALHEAVTRDWCHEIESILSDIGYGSDDLAFFSTARELQAAGQNSVAVDSDQRVAVKADDDDRPWHIIVGDVGWHSNIDMARQGFTVVWNTDTD